jgi:uncharacterized protein (TIGR00251 family)
MFEQTSTGVMIHVRAQPGAKQNGITGEHAGMLKVSVTAPADKGRANAAIIACLADQLGTSKSAISLVSGATSRQKKFLVAGQLLPEVAKRLQPNT